MQFKKYRSDLILIGALLLIGFIILTIVLTTSATGAMAQIKVDGTILETFPLSKEQTYVIHTDTGGTNTLIIENGSARITEASCPDGVCVHTGSINKTGQTIVCLPNKVVVEIIGGAPQETTDVDIIAGAKP